MSHNIITLIEDARNKGMKKMHKKQTSSGQPIDSHEQKVSQSEHEYSTTYHVTITINLKIIH